MSDAYGSVSQGSPIVLPDLPVSERSFWACSGALAADLTASQGELAVGDGHYQASQPAQYLAVGDRTNWVSASLGGNDVGFSDLGKACAAYSSGKTISRFPRLSKVTCAEALDAGEKLLPALKATLLENYRQLLDRAPRATLAIVGYPRIFPGDYSKALTTKDKRQFCATNNLSAWSLGFEVSNAKAIDQRIVVGLNDVARSIVRELGGEAAYAGRLVYADPYKNSVPQDCTGATPNVSVNGLVLSPGANGTDPNLAYRLLSTATFHPTRLGQRVLGQAVQDAFQSVRLRYAGDGLDGSGTIGQPLTLSTSVEGGQAPLTVTPAVDARLPAWLTLGLDGRSVVVSGTPSTGGSWSFTAVVTDAHGDSVDIPVRILVTSANPFSLESWAFEAAWADERLDFRWSLVVAGGELLISRTVAERGGISSDFAIYCWSPVTGGRTFGYGGGPYAEWLTDESGTLRTYGYGDSVSTYGSGVSQDLVGSVCHVSDVTLRDQAGNVWQDQAAVAALPRFTITAG